MTKISITWKRSGIGHPRSQRRTIASLGLRRLHQTVIHDNTPSIKGMVDKVSHLVEVTDAHAESSKERTSD